MTEQGKTHLTTNVSEGRSGAEDCRESAMSNKPVAWSNTVIAPERAHRRGSDKPEGLPDTCRSTLRLRDPVKQGHFAASR